MESNQEWLDWAIELQAIAQAGLAYSKDVYDIERFERIRTISAEMMVLQTDTSFEKVIGLFCNDKGYQTPKLDTRAAIFKNDKILLVQENNGEWSLPGGWVDIDQSVKENTIKEVKEEAGLEVTADWLIAVQDRDKHNLPRYAYSVCKIFVYCTLLGGQFQENSETISSEYFSLEQLPQLANAKTTKEQIEICFEAYKSKHWQTQFD